MVTAMQMFRRFFAILSLALLVGCGQEEVPIEESNTPEAAPLDPIAAVAIDRAKERNLVMKITADQDYANQPERQLVAGGKPIRIPYFDPETRKPTKKKSAEIGARRYSDNSYEAEGKYTEWRPNGKVFIEGEYRNGKREGKWTFYHANGEVAKKVNYQDGLTDGVVKQSRDDGTQEAVRSYKAGKLHGVWKALDEKENATMVQHFKDGKPHGLRTTWYSPGEKEIQPNFKAQQNFKEGKLDGEAKIWHENGKLAQLIHFVDGRRHGPTTVWNEEGKVLREFEYSKGKIVRE